MSLHAKNKDELIEIAGLMADKIEQLHRTISTLRERCDKQLPSSLSSDDYYRLLNERNRLQARVDGDYKQAVYLFSLCAPQCTPLNDTSGVLSQLSNYIAGLTQDIARLQTENKRLLELNQPINASREEAAFWDAIEQAEQAGGGE